MTKLADLDETTWQGENRLWLGPDAPAAVSAGTLTIKGPTVQYTWEYENQPQRGELTLSADGSAEWTDTWHQPTTMECTPNPGPDAPVAVLGSYKAGDGPDWYWRIILGVRPGGELIMQMINITPWGEEMTAVLMVCTRDRPGK